MREVPFMRFSLRSSVVAVLLVGAGAFVATVPAAQAQVFTFEGQAATANAASQPGALTVLTETQGGLTLTLTREAQGRFDVFDTNAFPGSFPGSFGQRSLSPFFQETLNTAFIGNFSSALTSVSIEFGDFGGDSDTFTLEAYSGLNGSGALLASTTVPYGTATFPGSVGTGGVTSVTGIQSIRFIGGAAGTFPNSVYYDNITVRQQEEPSAAPETATLALVGMGLLPLVGAIIGRRRSKA